jgi:hypothetical protein
MSLGQNDRSRARQTNRGRGPNPLTRSYDSHGPDVRIRGTAQHVAERYLQLARDDSGRLAPGTGELEETSVGNYSGHVPTASQLRTDAANGFDAPLTDQAGLTKPKHRHEYFPNLPQPKGFSHGLPRIAATKVLTTMGDSTP